MHRNERAMPTISRNDPRNAVPRSISILELQAPTVARDQVSVRIVNYGLPTFPKLNQHLTLQNERKPPAFADSFGWWLF
jgi:hypothetical protein